MRFLKMKQNQFLLLCLLLSLHRRADNFQRGVVFLLHLKRPFKMSVKDDTVRESSTKLQTRLVLNI
jgi:hypothetical protein